MFNKFHKEDIEKQRIFNIALEIIEEVGYEGLSIRALCSKADISTGKFYVWYLEYTVEHLGFDSISHFYSNDNEILSDTGSYNNAIISLTATFLQKAVQKGYVIPDDKSIHDIANDLCVIVKGCIFQ